MRDGELAGGKEHTLGMVMRLAQHQRAMEILGPIQEPVYPGVWGPRKKGLGGLRGQCHPGGSDSSSWSAGLPREACVLSFGYF